MTFPAEMLIDYVRVYQRKGYENIGCDPQDYPTMDYINRHPVAYNSLSCFLPGIILSLLIASLHADPQLQYWTPGTAGANYTLPKNSMVRLDFCSSCLSNMTFERVAQRLLMNWINAAALQPHL